VWPPAIGRGGSNELLLNYFIGNKVTFHIGICLVEMHFRHNSFCVIRESSIVLWLASCGAGAVISQQIQDEQTQHYN
jgi:hypothetical protein